MFATDTLATVCPYCNESIELVVDLSVPAQTYIEDCQVCCRPMTVQLEVDNAGQAALSLRHEDDV
ncbi:MAG: CPXCG motif-containing cysteine-rich protein [Gammaproteobacteria bacterium]|nr:CPXCG motif-containing cysteine-rich protein [Gammaproteobacteria bacterium]